MKNQFSKLTNRWNSGSLKWKLKRMNPALRWVADMDFETAPEIIEALKQRVEHGILDITSFLMNSLKVFRPGG